MKSNSQQHSESSTEPKPDPEFIAQQLRKPSGKFAPKIAMKMNEVNKPLYDLTFDVMKLKQNSQVLEIGFGNGKFFDKLFSKKPGLQVRAIDLSVEMVEAAKKNNGKAIDSGKLKINQGNSAALPFDDELFDAVFCNMVIYFWEQPAEHLKEIKRVLKPGGTFYTGLRTRETMLDLPFVQFGFNLYSVKEWEKVLEDNGFKVVDVQTRLDPEIQDEDNVFRFESCCMVAEKKAV